MDRPIRGLRPCCALLIAALFSVLPAACGSSNSSSSADPASLLTQTFTGNHTVTSGQVSFNLTLSPAGSSTLKGPITLSFGGPFQSHGVGKLPASNFTIAVSALGNSGSIGILSTGTAGYVKFQGASYRLPAATFQKLESSFSQLAARSSGGSGSGSLSKLGIDPQHWLVNPSVVGSATVGGAQTTHIRASVNVAALLGDLDQFLHKASSLGVSGADRIPTSISQATRARIAGEVKRPTVDVWTGSSDKTLRKLALALTVPVSGQASSLLGGLSSSGIGLTVQYADVNQPQTILAPSTVRPFSEFQAQLNSYLAQVQGALGGAAAGSSGSSGSSSQGSAATGSSIPSNVQSYSQCIKAAGTDVSKMQHCASLLNRK
jgi:hypothetical protein